MRRSAGLLACVMAAIGCSAPVPLGVYRLPVQTGTESLQLKTFFVRLEGEELVLRDVGRDEEFGRAISRTSWMGEPQPYSFGKLGGYPFTLYVRDGVIEDVETRPWQTQPVPPLVSGELTATLAVVGSDGGELRLLKAGDLLFAEAPVTPPASDAVPDPLVVLGSVAGAGLVLRGDAPSGAEWKDAVSAQVPVAPEKAMACGMPLRSLYRSMPASSVTVPAGDFEAVHVMEIVDVCPGSTLAPTVWKVERWFAPGIGPVRMLATLSDGRMREYLLVETNASGDSQALWPMTQGIWWDWQVLDPDGNVVKEAARVEVRSADERVFPL